MTDFESNLKAIERFIGCLAHRMFKLVQIERADGEQMLREAAWEMYMEHIGNIEVMEQIQKYMCSAVSFASKRIINSEYKKMRVRERKSAKVFSMIRNQEDDISELLLVRAALDKFKEKLTDRERYVCIMIENGYGLVEMASYLKVNNMTVVHTIKKIQKKYKTLGRSSVI